MIYIGIDPGTHTGLAIWDSPKEEFVTIDTLSIIQALDKVARFYKDNKGLFDIMLLFEDARQRTWYGHGNTNAKLQGAGSVKRDCNIWEEFCKEKGIPFRAIPPQKGGTKLTPQYFRLLTGYKGRTSEHARDAAMLVFNR